MCVCSIYFLFYVSLSHVQVCVCGKQDNKIRPASQFGLFPLCPALGIRRKAFTSKSPQIAKRYFSFDIHRGGNKISILMLAKRIPDPCCQKFDGCQLMRKCIEDFTSLRFRGKRLDCRYLRHHLNQQIIIIRTKILGHQYRKGKGDKIPRYCND